MRGFAILFVVQIIINTVKKIKEIALTFKFPFFILLSILASLIIQFVFAQELTAKIVLMTVVIVGSFPLFKENILELFHHKFALDYIALLAIVVGLLSGQFLVAAIIVLMLAGGTTLEAYGNAATKESLTGPVDRIPNDVLLWANEAMTQSVSIESVKVGQEIFVRKGEVVPLDGVLISLGGLTDESSLTGEPYMIDKIKGDWIRSGTVNIGEGIIVKVTKASEDSTYRKIIEMVKAAQAEKAPLLRLADKYSVIFTIVTLVMATVAYLLSHDFSRVLAVLVIATPCPLILATPIALMGGMNASAKKRIIMKKLSSIEVLSRVNAVIFDKTGTITLGKPFVKTITIFDGSYSEEKIYSIAEAIERNSIHPLAKAIVETAKEKKCPILMTKDVKEIIGSGISGVVQGENYSLSKVKEFNGMAIQILKNEEKIAVFEFEDRLKEHSKEIVAKLKNLGLELFIFTGDKLEAAQEVAKQLGEMVTVRAQCSPEDKRNGILELKKTGKVTAMVGDGINDAPALAAADVGIVFSNEEQTASSEAADVVFLGGDFSSVTDVIDISKNSIRIAMQSILFGIGISTVGMMFAAGGFVTPIAGAFVQETIDVLVIFNALRASRLE